MKIQQGAAAQAEDGLSEEQERLKELETRLKPLTVRIESLIAPVKGGRDGDGYSIANEGIMRVGNMGGLALLEDISPDIA